MKKLLLVLWATLTVPLPKYDDMVLRCDAERNCVWQCEKGIKTVQQVVDGSELLVSSGCKKEFNDIQTGSQTWNNRYWYTPL